MPNRPNDGLIPAGEIAATAAAGFVWLDGRGLAHGDCRVAVADKRGGVDQVTHQSRRKFLGKLTVGAPALAAAGIAANPAMANGVNGGRRVVAGSPYPTFSRAVVLDRTAFVSGVVGQKPGTRELVSEEFEPQCKQALENLKASVEAAGSSMANVVKCTCFLTDASDFGTFNKIYVGYFPSGPPARSTVIVKALVVEGARLEIDCVAAVD